MILLLTLSGCASRKLIVMELDDAIKAVGARLTAAHCQGTKLSAADVEFFVKSAYKLDVGAPTGAIPITLGGGAAFEESSKVKVTFPSPDCPKAGVMRLEPLKPLLYDPDSGTVQELKR